MYGGGTLVVLGILALPIGLVTQMSDSWATDGGPGEARVSPRGLLVMLGGAVSIGVGSGIFHVGHDRRDAAVREFRERHPAAVPPR